MSFFTDVADGYIYITCTYLYCEAWKLNSDRTV